MFMIISPDDSQVFEMKDPRANKMQEGKDHTYLQELIAYASLDAVDKTEWGSTSMYTKGIDRFNEYTINSFITPGSKDCYVNLICLYL